MSQADEDAILLVCRTAYQTTDSIVLIVAPTERYLDGIARSFTQHHYAGIFPEYYRNTSQLYWPKSNTIAHLVCERNVERLRGIRPDYIVGFGAREWRNPHQTIDQLQYFNQSSNHQIILT